eukprot:CAMPEP_0178722860 /NCGR_PEP_ID=MMETSP0699-20121125/25224_1 /TAXON_ID=265572 /ORGANISM="Extubocellulus spinifer, Strain CCMP396" /LENGTH=116 /DNA_ID=CAMNT_0020373873 /DNA_START=15 /DNA_END=365 /DNA_ORIENTATION=+
MRYCPKKRTVVYQVQYDGDPAEDPIPEGEIEEADLQYYVACLPITTNQRGQDLFRPKQPVWVKSGQDYKTDWSASIVDFVGDKRVLIRYDSGTEETVHVARVTPIEGRQRRRKRSN